MVDFAGIQSNQKGDFFGIKDFTLIMSRLQCYCCINTNSSLRMPLGPGLTPVAPLQAIQRLAAAPGLEARVRSSAAGQFVSDTTVRLHLSSSCQEGRKEYMSKRQWPMQCSCEG